MPWSYRLFDTMTGLLAEPIDIPSMSWSANVSDTSLSTTKDKGSGDMSGSGISLPWGAVPGATREAKLKAIAPMKRGLVVFWDKQPVVAGVIGWRTDSVEDTSFSLISPMGMLDDRYLFDEARGFGKGSNSTSPGSIVWKSKSYRAIACLIIDACTNNKPGGYLPFDLPYLSESGTRERTYWNYNVANNSAKKLLTELANVENGPDMQFRPQLADDTHLEWRFEAASDADIYLRGTSPTPTLVYGPQGGTAQGVQVAWSGPTMRVLATGSGQDESTLCDLQQDLTLCERQDPWPLVEVTKSDSDWETASVLQSHAKSYLAAIVHPTCQITCEVDAADPKNPVKPGLVWPGEPVDLVCDNHPALPDQTLHMRLMQMSGNASNAVKLTFDVMSDPWGY